MKLNEILVESAGLMLTYKQLTPLQVSILKGIASGRFTVDSVNDRNRDVVEELFANRLVDDLSFELTPDGEKMLELVSKYGSYERRNMRQAVSALDRQSSEIADAPEEFEVD
jgi:hypothetical protein